MRLTSGLDCAAEPALDTTHLEPEPDAEAEAEAEAPQSPQTPITCRLTWPMAPSTHCSQIDHYCSSHRATTTTSTARVKSNPSPALGSCQMLFIISFILSVSTQSLQSASHSTTTTTSARMNRISPSIFTPPPLNHQSLQWTRDIIPRSLPDMKTNKYNKDKFNDNNDRQAAIRSQLSELKQQLLELHSPSAKTDDNPRSQSSVHLNAPCLSSISCQQAISHSHCELANFTCACLPQHVEYNSTTCLPPSLLGFECLLDGQCQQKVANSVCLQGRCACSNHFVPYRKDKCLPASKVNEFCLTDGQCRLNDRHSHCKWRIPHVYGQCKCPPNYKLITSSPPPPSDGTSPHQPAKISCAPRLGDACLTDAECLLATKNSVCKRPISSAHAAATTTTWTTSSASSDRCQCARGLREAPNRLDCEKEPSSEVNIGGSGGGGGGGNSSLTTAKHHYDMIPGQSVAVSGAGSGLASDMRPADELDIKILDANTSPRNQITSTTTTSISTTETTTSQASQITSTITAPTTTTTTTASPVVVIYTNQTASIDNNNNNRRLRMSSLGKACSSDRQCQARDPNSYCSPSGICDCLVASAACSAASTGCHRDTFQCDNGQCISWYFVCDQFRNCDDGSDEDNCTPNTTTLNKCPPEAFQCRSASGGCITRGKLCNGQRDCPDGSDELDCGGGGAIGMDLKQQLASSTTIRKCHPSAFTCQNGQCLPAYVFCNAVEDCADGSDEEPALCERTHRKWPQTVANKTSQVNDTMEPPEAAAKNGSQRARPPSTSSPKAPTSDTNRPMAIGGGGHLSNESPLVKTDRAAIERLLASLALASRTPQSRGRPSGASGRRSRLMQATTTQQPAECPRDSFTCRNGKCRSTAILCSGVDGCGDNSDEDRCEVCQCPAPAASTATATAKKPVHVN